MEKPDFLKGQPIVLATDILLLEIWKQLKELNERAVMIPVTKSELFNFDTVTVPLKVEIPKVKPKPKAKPRKRKPVKKAVKKEGK